MKSGYEKLKTESKKKSTKSTGNRKSVKKTEKFEDVKQAIFLSQGIMIATIIISFIMSLFVPELSFLCRIFFIILTFIMAVSNYLIYKKAVYSIIYLLVGIGFIIGTIFGM